MMRSFLKLQAVDPGLNPRSVLAFTVSLAGLPEYVGAKREAFYPRNNPNWLTIVGLIKDVKQGDLKVSAFNEVYLPSPFHSSRPMCKRPPAMSLT